MEVRDALLRRRSIRQYQNKPIPEADIKEIMEAAMYAPSAVNYQPWYFVVVQSPEKMQQLCAVMDHVSSVLEPALNRRFVNHPQVAEETVGFMKRLGGAPVCVLAFALKPEYEEIADIVPQSVAAAIENMLLMATAKGIGSCWLTAPVEAKVGGQLRDTFAPGKGDLVAIVALGYPAHIPEAPARKSGRCIYI